MKKILLVSGKARHGKSTLAEILKDHLEYQNNKCLIIAYGNYVKYIAKTYFGWDGKKDEKGRQLLQYVGTDLVRKKLNKPNYWVDRVMDVIQMVQNEYDYFIIPDCRFSNEIEIPKQIYNDLCTSIRIERLNFKSDLTEEQLRHSSETVLDNYDFDYYIKSENGINNLISKILETFDWISPIPKLEIANKVTIKKILNLNKAQHLNKYINKSGHILSYINIKNKIKYKVIFDNNETAYFFRNELEKIVKPNK